MNQQSEPKPIDNLQTAKHDTSHTKEDLTPQKATGPEKRDALQTKHNLLQDCLQNIDQTKNKEQTNEESTQKQNE